MASASSGSLALSQNAWDYTFGMWDRLYLEHTSNGHYKFYEMSTNTAMGDWKARYGSIGKNGITKEYNRVEWNAKLSEKLKKGYKIVTVNSKISVSATKSMHEDVNTEYLARIDRVLLILRENTFPGKTFKFEVDFIKNQYIEFGVLTKQGMMKINEIYNEIKKYEDKEIESEDK